MLKQANFAVIANAHKRSVDRVNTGARHQAKKESRFLHVAWHGFEEAFGLARRCDDRTIELGHLFFPAQLGELLHCGLHGGAKSR